MKSLKLCCEILIIFVVYGSVLWMLGADLEFVHKVLDSITTETLLFLS